MDPNYPNANSTNGFTPYQNPGSPALSPKKGPFSKKMLLIGGAVLLVLILIIVVLMSGGKKSNKQATNNPQLDSSLYVDRKGYFNEAGGVGDATALYSKPSSQIVSFKGTNVIQPCALITIQDIRDNGLYIIANPLTGPVEQSAYTGQGSQSTPEPSKYIIRSGEKNTCSYYVQKDTRDDPGVVEATVYQSFDASSEAIDDDVSRKYVIQAAFEGIDMKVYKNAKTNNLSPNESTYFIRGNSVSAEFRINVTNKDKEGALLKLFVERLYKAQTTPTPRMQYGYKSPVMSKEIFSSCDILNDANFKQVMGAEAGPMTKEKFSTAIGIMTNPKTKKDFNYASYDCRRDIVDGQGDGAFYIQTETFENESDAAVLFEYTQRPDALATGIQAVNPAIGDASFYGNPAAMKNALVVRKGRLIIHASYYNDARRDITASERISKLRPILEAAVSGLKEY